MNMNLLRFIAILSLAFVLGYHFGNSWLSPSFTYAVEGGPGPTGNSSGFSGDPDQAGGPNTGGPTGGGGAGGGSGAPSAGGASGGGDFGNGNTDYSGFGFNSDGSYTDAFGNTVGPNSPGVGSIAPSYESFGAVGQIAENAFDINFDPIAGPIGGFVDLSQIARDIADKTISGQITSSGQLNPGTIGGQSYSVSPNTTANAMLTIDNEPVARSVGTPVPSQAPDTELSLAQARVEAYKEALTAAQKLGPENRDVIMSGIAANLYAAELEVKALETEMKAELSQNIEDAVKAEAVANLAESAAQVSEEAREAANIGDLDAVEEALDNAIALSNLAATANIMPGVATEINAVYEASRNLAENLARNSTAAMMDRYTATALNEAIAGAYKDEGLSGVNAIVDALNQEMREFNPNASISVSAMNSATISFDVEISDGTNRTSGIVGVDDTEIDNTTTGSTSRDLSQYTTGVSQALSAAEQYEQYGIGRQAAEALANLGNTAATTEMGVMISVIDLSHWRDGSLNPGTEQDNTFYDFNDFTPSVNQITNDPSDRFAIDAMLTETVEGPFTDMVSNWEREQQIRDSINTAVEITKLSPSVSGVHFVSDIIGYFTGFNPIDSAKEAVVESMNALFY